MSPILAQRTVYKVPCSARDGLGHNGSTELGVSWVEQATSFQNDGLRLRCLVEGIAAAERDFLQHESKRLVGQHELPRLKFVANPLPRPSEVAATTTGPVNSAQLSFCFDIDEDALKLVLLLLWQLWAAAARAFCATSCMG